ncbi:tRNA (N6-isopentenyl adenosine(37)-C2)-methylthiotransferase MiaB [Blastopirellula sp. JC732]|uniref:tRNA-2-methylthio-N(6)-dimethylallyladenosine synthase n=1 Tax=Blastopirellula sediminis TaxID=2894196 RepID=A0A9X1SHY3_9BACT|nr:tRNA (N6-isopentenyl adenosine(37)-C2)-methylthiotransferase MiaB [Blastopirellula sediminis]MCC9606406.1 tRNA (N6-isopentenyl adenosine(37)-C2)-methylthiotransferase MiaB [Blastopirellula sediminis]MCC9630296.1 tRNA (N6-isopentenyl adenosine(37)-C2)-methylthiotransferase MiaB [Blastopirellula sediminis]
MPKRLYIDTVGCQMNMLDSELVVASLRQQGYELTTKPEEADTLLFNTCSVREQAENKTYSHLGVLRDLKASHPEKIIGVMGCMAQNHQKKIFQRAPYVDLVVGPGQLHQIPSLIEKVAAGEGRQIEVSLGRKDGSRAEIARSHESFDPLRDPEMRPTPFQAYVRIQIGCDKFCTYCIVPSVRGPEQGRSPEDILAETRHLAEQGTVEITLVGQTVNSYRGLDAAGKMWNLADLLAAIHEIDGIRRIKFVTNYPKDMTDELLTAVRELEKVSPYLHVPVQSGSNEVLKRMKRGYTVEQYREMMQRIREGVPGAAVSSDFIVGFCGETEEDFQMTVDLVEECRFKNSFIFKYSEREGTRGAELFLDDVPQKVKQERNNTLLEIQNRISLEDNQKQIGNTVEVLVEGISKTAARKEDAEDSPIVQLTGRTHCDRIVVFDGNRRQIGQILPVAIYDSAAHTLFGEVITQECGSEVYMLG